MATAKTTTLTFRIEPELKEALRTAAQNEHRSIANMVAVLIRDYCEKTVSLLKRLHCHRESRQGSETNSQ